MLSNTISSVPELIGYELGFYPEVINWEGNANHIFLPPPKQPKPYKMKLTYSDDSASD